MIEVHNPGHIVNYQSKLCLGIAFKVLCENKHRDTHVFQQRSYIRQTVISYVIH